MLESLLGWVELVLRVEVYFVVLVQVDLVVLDLRVDHVAHVEVVEVLLVEFVVVDLDLVVQVFVDRVRDVHLVELFSGDRFL